MSIVRCLAAFALLILHGTWCSPQPKTSTRSSLLNKKGAQASAVSKAHVIKSCDDFIAAAKKAKISHKPLVIKIYADWCPASQEIQKAYEQYAKEAKDQAFIASINSDQEGVEPLLHILGVEALPTTVVIHQLEGVEGGDAAYNKWLHKQARTTAQVKNNSPTTTSASKNNNSSGKNNSGKNNPGQNLSKVPTKPGSARKNIPVKK